MPLWCEFPGRRVSRAAALGIALYAMPAPHATLHPVRGLYRAPTGTIRGTVLLSPTLSARRPRFRIYSDVGPGAEPPDSASVNPTAEMANVVLYLLPDSAGRLAAATHPSRSQHPAIAQQGERFVPHVLAVARGTTVDFPNEDDVYHNVFSLSSAAVFDLGRYPKGKSRSVTFNRAGIVPVFCHIHSDMSAIVLVLDDPFFTSPDAMGHFTIDGVPPGDYTVVGWHERVHAVEHRVHVAAGATTDVQFNIPLPPPGQETH